MQDARFTNRMDRKRALRLWDEWKNRGDLEKVRAEMRPASAHISPQCTMRIIPKDPLPKSPGVLRDMVLALVTDKDGRLYEPCLPVQAILSGVEAEQTLNNVLEYWETTDGPINEKERTEIISSLKESLNIVLWYFGEKEGVPSVLQCQLAKETTPTEERATAASHQGEAASIPDIAVSEQMEPAQNEAVDASSGGKIQNYIEIVEAFLEQNNIALEENQRQAIRAVVLKLGGKTNAQVFKELSPEAPFRTDHKGRGFKMVNTGLAILRDNGIDITP